MVTPLCFVPNCDTGSVSCKEDRCLFAPPADEARLIEWRRAIPRKDRKLTGDDRICERHFEARFVQRTWKIEYEGRVLAEGERRPYLTKDAVPTLFSCARDSNRAGSRLQAGGDDPDRAELPSPCKMPRLEGAGKMGERQSRADGGQGRAVTMKCYGRSVLKAASEGKTPVSTAQTGIESVAADEEAGNCEEISGTEPPAVSCHGRGESRTMSTPLDTEHDVPSNEIPTKGCTNALEESSEENPPNGLASCRSAPLAEEIGDSEDTNHGIQNQSQGSQALGVPTLSSSVARTTTSPQIVVLKAKAIEEASPESSFDLLFRTAKQLRLPSDSWAVHCVEANDVRDVVFSQLVVKHEPAMMTVHSTKTVLVKSDMNVTVLLLNKPVKSVGDISTEVSSIAELERLLSAVDAARLCRGGPKHKLYPKARPECAYLDSMRTWRHSECPLILAEPGTACKQCQRLFQTLRIHTRRLEAREKAGKSLERIRIPRLCDENRVAVLRKARVDLQRSNSRLERRLQMLREELRAVKQEIKALQEGVLEPECEQVEGAYEIEVDRSQDSLEEQIEEGGEALEQQFVDGEEIYEHMEAGQTFQPVQVEEIFEGEVVEQAVYPSDQGGPAVFVVY